MATLAVQARASQEPKKRYAFWETQPVSQFDERGATVRASGICLSTRNNKLCTVCLPTLPPLCSVLTRGASLYI